MNTTGIERRWDNQTPITRVAVSAALAFAVMLTLYLVLATSPSPVGMHAALYRVFETQSQAWEFIAAAVLCFCIGMQLLIAYACARASQSSAAEGRLILASETLVTGGLFVLWLAGGVLALANFSPDFFTAKGANNWDIAGMLLITQLFGILAIIVPFVNSSDETERNRVMLFAVGKGVLCLVYLVFGQSTLTLTLVVGTFLLDFLLHPVGVVPKETLEGG